MRHVIDEVGHESTTVASIAAAVHGTETPTRSQTDSARRACRRLAEHVRSQRR